MVCYVRTEAVTRLTTPDYLNRSGANLGSKVLMIVVAILNAGRNSFSFFLLLIVCMGYGVVKHTLGKTMIYVRWLAGAHFVFGLIYSIASLTITPEQAGKSSFILFHNSNTNLSGPIVLFVILPLAGTLTAFYVWTLNSLNLTMKDLLERKQTVKALMYRKLWWCILASIAIIFGFFFLNSFTFASASDPDFVPFHWKTRWFLLDGWLNLVYLADVMFIAYLWRPTANNRRFAMSDELAQDDEGFEIADFGVESEDEDSDQETGVTQPHEQRYDPAPARNAGPPPPRKDEAKAAPSAPSQERDRDSFEDDEGTMFAVGEDGDNDRWSEDEGDDEEGKHLVHK